MRNIEYKYNVGDYVRFKSHYASDASCDLFERAGAIAVVADRADFNGPAYKLSCDEDSWYKEGCFEGLASGSEFLAQQALTSGVDTLQGPETNRDTGDSGEFLSRDKCRELYLKALEKTYGKVPFESETVVVGSLLDFTEAILAATKEV